MKNRELAAYIGESPSNTKKIFGPLQEAFEDTYLGDIGIELAELHESGALPMNFELYLNRLQAKQLLCETAGFRPLDAETIIKSGAFDPWTLLNAAACRFTGEAIPPDFEPLVIKPGIDYLKIHSDESAAKLAGREKALKIMQPVLGKLKKIVDDMEKIEPWKLAGSREESIFIKLNNAFEMLERE